MAEKVEILEGKIIEIVSKGHVEINDINQTAQLVKYYYDIEGFRKVLIDITNQDTIPSALEIMSFLPDLDNLNVAIVYSDNTKTLETIKDFSTDAIEVNIHIKLFDNREKGLDWLNTIDMGI